MQRAAIHPATLACNMTSCACDQVDSFFNFFDPPAIPSEEVDEDDMAELQELLEADYELGYV